MYPMVNVSKIGVKLVKHHTHKTEPFSLEWEKGLLSCVHRSGLSISLHLKKVVGMPMVEPKTNSTRLLNYLL